MSQDKSENPRPKRGAVPVNGVVAVLLCAGAIGLSGGAAMKAVDPDQGRTYTLTEARTGQAQMWERIQNDSRIPDRVKGFARSYSGGGAATASPSPAPN